MAPAKMTHFECQ